MQIPYNILLGNYSIEEGKVYFGNLALDGSPHCAIVAKVINGEVHYFCFTSREEKINIRRKNDPLAVLDIDDTVAKLLFPLDTKKTFLYCGRMNWQKKSVEEFMKMIADGTAEFRYKIEDDLYSEIKNAINSSVTLSKAEKKLLTS